MLKSTFGLFSPCLRADAQLLDAPAASVPDATPEHAGREGEVGDRDRGGGLGDQRGLPPEAARHRECGHLGGESAVSECMQRAEIILFDGVYTEKRQKPTSYKLPFGTTENVLFIFTRATLSYPSYRWGGRVHTEKFGSSVVEIGANWIHGGCVANPVFNMANRRRKSLLLHDGKVYTVHTVHYILLQF